MTSNKEIDKLKKAIKEKKIELSKIMATSGSFCAMTPGYTETEHEIKFLEDRLKALENKIKKHSANKKPGEVGINSEVTLIENNKILKIKILFEIPTPMPKDFKVATPDSPVGKKLLAKKIGDRVAIDNRTFLISNIK